MLDTRRRGFTFGTHRRRRNVSYLYVSGQPQYYGRSYNNPQLDVGRTKYGMVAGRFTNECIGAAQNTAYGFSCNSKIYDAGCCSTTSAVMYSQAYLNSECTTSCSNTKVCTGQTNSANVAKSVSGMCIANGQEKMTFPGNVAGMKRDYLMGTGFIPNGHQWPIKLTITNLVYQKSIVGTQNYNSATDMPVQDLYFIYGESDSTVNLIAGGASSGASLGLGAGLAAAGAAYFGAQQ